MLLGYGFVGDEEDLIAVGCAKENLYIDPVPPKKGRWPIMEQLEELKGRAARKRDTIVVLYMRRLGATEKARAKPLLAFKRRGAKVDVRSPPPKPKKKRGRKPSKIATKSQWDIARPIWLNDELSERVRLNAIKAATITEDCPEGLDLTRGICNGRFGWPERPKPLPEEDE